jgi:hypothetical protein
VRVPNDHNIISICKVYAVGGLPKRFYIDMMSRLGIMGPFFFGCAG